MADGFPAVAIVRGVLRLRRSPLLRYAVAILASGLALALNVPLYPIVGSNTFPPFLAAVMVATWFGGLGPGLLATVLTGMANGYFFLWTDTSTGVGDIQGLVRSVLYGLSALLITALGARLRSAHAHAEVSRADADRNAASFRDAEKKLRTLLEGIRDYAVLMLDADGKIASWNPGAEKIYGYAPSEALGRHVSELFTPEDIAAGRPARVLASVQHADRTEDQAWRVRKDGSRFWADVVYTALRDDADRLRGYSVVARDVTEGKRAEEAMRASEARFRGLLELAPDAIVIVEPDGRIVLANSQAQQLFGYGPEELLGQHVEILLPEHLRSMHVGHRSSFTSAPRTRPMGVGLDLAGRRKDGTTFPVEISLSPMKTDDGFLVMSAIRDITDRKRAEARIKALNEDLGRRVAELAAVNKELEAFSYSVSHDLRSPLRSIDGFSQALLEEYSGTIDDQGQDYLRRVRAATQRMGELIDDLLNLSRVTRRELHREAIDLSTLARQIVSQLQKADPYRSAEFTIADELIVFADSHLMRVALENLLGNAWKFTGKEPMARIALGVTEHDGRPTYFVRDNGVGFDMAYSSKLFGAFQRLHRSTEFPGTGIGLATVQRIINRHGGRIWADAEIGKGATFYFTL